MKELLSAEALAEIKKFNRNVEWLKKREVTKQPDWVRSNVILLKTGWSRSELDTAKRNGYIKSKGSGKDTRYDPNSINPDYLAITQARKSNTSM